MTRSTSPAKASPVTAAGDAAVGPPTDTRARVLEAALELFAEQGFASTSTRELSERLGFTKAALYYHFRTKDDLLAALIAPALADLRSLVTEPPSRPTAAARRRLLVRYIACVGRHQRLIQLLSQDPSTTRSPALTEAAPLYETFIARLVGSSEPSTADTTRARFVLGGIHAALLHGRVDDDPTVVPGATLAAACAALGIPTPRT